MTTDLKLWFLRATVLFFYCHILTAVSHGHQQKLQQKDWVLWIVVWKTSQIRVSWRTKSANKRVLGGFPLILRDTIRKGKLSYFVYIMRREENKSSGVDRAFPGERAAHPENPKLMKKQKFRKNGRKVRDDKWGNVPLLSTRVWESGYAPVEKRIFQRGCGKMYREEVFQ